LRLDLILDNKSLALVIDLLRELGRDGVVGRDILNNQTLVSVNTLVDGRFLNGPFADISPILLRLGVFLLGVRRSPPRFPVVRELFQEGSFKAGRLKRLKSANKGHTEDKYDRTNRESRSFNDRRGIGG
jgi:hypothetical protein